LNFCTNNPPSKTFDDINYVSKMKKKLYLEGGNTTRVKHSLRGVWALQLVGFHNLPTNHNKACSVIRLKGQFKA